MSYLKSMLIEFNAREQQLWHKVAGGGLQLEQAFIKADPGSQCLEFGSKSLSDGFMFFKRQSTWQDMKHFEGIWIQCSGTVDACHLFLENSQCRGFFSYQAPVAVDEEVSDLFVPFDDFVPVRRGMVLENAPRLGDRSISAIGILIETSASEQTSLVVKGLGGYRELETLSS